MSISSQAELLGMQKASEAVAVTLRKMREYARPGMSTAELDAYGFALLEAFGARSAPKLTYDFPGYTCISVNNEIAHGIPSRKTILQDGDLVNVDVSAELDGFWADNGGSFVLGEDRHQHQKLVDASRSILQTAIMHIRDGVKINVIGGLIEAEARKRGYRVIKNLNGHGIGRGLHEAPHSIANYYDKHNRAKFRKNLVVAIETFISTRTDWAYENGDGWTLASRDGSFVAQHEHTIVVTDGLPVILTKENGIWE
ncbi:type I methionyl aminopeptidase [Chitinophaga lutea]|uniref:Methionine aminopeptidase n=1 Tax=Chitinophaga lutea TaxID=2488634 RepID=A0A3N4PAI9_9BACT|nr:type I methionyl aminopeptidase [Chitinophaga lutea]RPE05673.1 type I methionyl aminopeptidase [Chitinophaga lutea]